MLEGLKEAMEYIKDLGVRAEKPQVLEICGKTYADKNLVQYGKQPKAAPVQARTLSAMMDYIENCSQEFNGRMIIHIYSPSEVKLISELDGDRERECLFQSHAEISGFQFDEWYDQERFMIELQANFEDNEDRKTVMKLAGNIEKKNEQTFSDDGTTQLATMQVGVATKADVIVPNPVELIPYRTFREVEQPASRFVLRIGERRDEPVFKIVEAEGGLWKNTATESIKQYFYDRLASLPEDISGKILVIG